MRIVVLGTGPFAVPSMQALYASPNEVVAVVSRPPRGRRAQPAPVTVAAAESGMETWLPETVNSDESRKKLLAMDADLLVVCDYGEILKSATLSTARLGGINLHGSLLPKYRGAAPVQWAVFNGEAETGNTIIQMTPGLDAGPCLGRQRVAIVPDETAGDLEARLAKMGAELVLEIVDSLKNGTAQPLEQDASQASKAPRLTKAQGQIDWTRSARQIKDHVRALQPWPRAFTGWQRAEGEPVRLIVHRVGLADSAPVGGVAPGRVVAVGKEFLVATGDGLLCLEQVQPAGKRPMSAAQFLRGYPVQVGQALR